MNQGSHQTRKANCAVEEDVIRNIKPFEEDPSGFMPASNTTRSEWTESGTAPLGHIGAVIAEKGWVRAALLVGRMFKALCVAVPGTATAFYYCSQQLAFVKKRATWSGSGPGVSQSGTSQWQLLAGGATGWNQHSYICHWQ